MYVCMYLCTYVWYVFIYVWTDVYMHVCVNTFSYSIFESFSNLVFCVSGRDAMVELLLQYHVQVGAVNPTDNYTPLM